MEKCELCLAPDVLKFLAQAHASWYSQTSQSMIAGAAKKSVKNSPQYTTIMTVALLQYLIVTYWEDLGR